MSTISLTEILANEKKWLTEKELEAWKCYYVLEWSYADIAASIGVDRSTVQRRVKRANAKLEAALREVS